MNVFYRFGGVNSADSGSYTLSGTTPVDLATTTYSSLTFQKTSTSTLEIGAVLTSGIKGARLSRITAVVTYTPLAAPSALTATATTTSNIALSWTDNASTTETGFSIERSLDGSSWSALASTTKGVISYYDTGLTASTTYYYRVRAFDFGGYSAFSGTASASTTGPPAAPSGLTATATTSAAIGLSWTDNATTTETGFSIERSLDGSSWSALATTSQGATSYYDSGLISYTTYYYRVRAFNAAGYSSFSGTANATTSTCSQTISSDITTDTTWTNACNVYVISGLRKVNSGVTLTINPGVIVKFQSDASFWVDGVLNAQGVSTSSVYFTAYTDDIGGDTNGDGTSTTTVGYWRHIRVNLGATTTLAYSVVRYGGNPISASADIWVNGGSLVVSNSEIASTSGAVIYQTSGTTNISNSTIHHSGSDAGVLIADGSVSISTSTLRNNTGYGLSVTAGSGPATVTGNSFLDNSSGAAFLDFAQGLTFIHSGNHASSGTNRGFKIAGDTIGNTTWTAEKLPYIINNIVTVGAGNTLSIEDGAVIKFDTGSGKISVNGELDAGTTTTLIEHGPWFTSLKDDLIIGDTNGDGQSLGAAGDWNSITINSGGVANIYSAVVRYGGNSASGAMIYNNGGTLMIATSTVATSSLIAIQTSGGGTTNITASDVAYGQYGVYVDNGTVTVQATSTLHDNSLYSAINTTPSLATLNAAGNYWGDVAGPYNAIANPTGTTTSPVSNNVTFDPWIGKGQATTTLHYVIKDEFPTCQTDTPFWCWSVATSTRKLLIDASTTAYSTQVNGAITTWNALGNVLVANATSSPANLSIVDISVSDGADLSYKARYFSPAENPANTIKLNSYYLASQSSDEVQNTATHEIGHALGLNHSYTGNVLYFLQSTQTALGLQDIADYKYLWPKI